MLEELLSVYLVMGPHSLLLRDESEWHIPVLTNILHCGAMRCSANLKVLVVILVCLMWDALMDCLDPTYIVGNGDGRRAD
jgi:hypothetical protein